MHKDMMMKRVAMKAMSAMEGLDASNIKAVSILFGKGKEMEEPEEEPCPMCGEEECECDAESNPDEDVEGEGDVDTEAVAKKEYGGKEAKQLKQAKGY